MMDRLLLPITGLVIAGIIAAAVYNGLPTHRNGRVGDTLQTKVISARLVDIDHPTAGHGMFSTPTPGTHFLGADIGLCNTRGSATGPYDFKLELSDGTKLGNRFPQSVYSHDFDGPDRGCERGWLLFEVPDGKTPKQLDYRYDGDNGRSQYANRRTGGTTEHDRFAWRL